ncbi:rCG28718, isoform CRA_a [Rattus norvegicus]|uniref:RCG28718, isoform CRA_a n=1 Tax=Rattus norvegicus TaxID=10116 RepID=A6HUW4_RAT|nr:rCG28718, isoform CRA_a [Rattus norvegicus]
MGHTRSPRAMPSCATLAGSTTCVGRQRRRGFVWTFWRNRSWTPAFRWAHSATALTSPVMRVVPAVFLLQEKRKPEFLKGLPDQLKLYSEFLGKQPWFAGDKITFADFLVYDVLDQHRMFEPKCLDAFPNLMDFVVHFEGLKKISAYMKTSRFLPSPVYLKQATWGNK